MSNLEFTAILGAASVAAGFLGSLTGMGGGVVIVPLLTLGFGVDIRYAVGASLVSVIATSSGAAAAYVREGFTNLRVGMFLETATVSGAIIGAGLATVLPAAGIAILFGAMLLYSAYMTFRHPQDRIDPGPPTGLARTLRMSGEFPTPRGAQAYTVRSVPGGFALMSLAGAMSGLLGIGSGALKVLAMDRIMRLPFKVSTTTSNMMIGVTAAGSAGVYLTRGYVDPGLAMPVMLGVLIGSLLGARSLSRAHVPLLRGVFAGMIVLLGAEMIYRGLTGRFRW